MKGESSSMEPATPSFLEIREPIGRQWTFGLASDRDQVTVGRSHEGPHQCDILLGTPTSKLISRLHCSFVRRKAKWWLVQHGKNCSWLRHKPELPQGEIELRAGEEVLLANGDLIRIRGEMSGRGRLYEIQFWDQETTQSPSTLSLRYDQQQKKLFLVKEGKEQRIQLSPYERKFVDFMLGQRQPGMICRYEDILSAVWPKDHTATQDNLRHLIMGLRDKLEPIPHKTRFLISHASQGYSLHTQPIE
jgi:Transcriptional regulatory protein, C terminal/FHA domain